MAGGRGWGGDKSRGLGQGIRAGAPPKEQFNLFVAVVHSSVWHDRAGVARSKCVWAVYVAECQPAPRL